MNGENAMTQATDELLLTTVLPPRKQAGLWHGVPIAWAIVAAVALGFGMLLLALPGDVLAPIAGSYVPDFLSRLVIALAGAGLIAGLMLTIFYLPAPQFGSPTISVPGGSRPLTVRRADAHPDAPPRRPLFAADEIGGPWQPEHVGGGENEQPSSGAGPVDSLINRLETGLTHKPSPAERPGPRAVGPDEEEHPSPAARQQRELNDALRESLDQLGGRIGLAKS
jgi:hypothetical protein